MYIIKALQDVVTMCVHAHACCALGIRPTTSLYILNQLISMYIIKALHDVVNMCVHAHVHT